VATQGAESAVYDCLVVIIANYVIVIIAHRATCCYTCRTFRGLCACLCIGMLGHVSEPGETAESTEMRLGARARLVLAQRNMH